MGRKQAIRRATRLVLQGAAIVVGYLTACSPSTDREEPKASRFAIIDGTPAPDLTGVVWLGHPQGSITCSGLLVAPSWVLTTKHCVFDGPGRAQRLLEVSDLEVGFGPNEGTLELRNARSVAWVPHPNDVVDAEGPAVDTIASIEAGLDIALVELAEFAPDAAVPIPLDADFTPRTGDEYTLAGYGIVSLVTGSSGVRRTSAETLSGFDPASGRLETMGNGACFGDSGGPVLKTWKEADAQAPSPTGAAGQGGQTAESQYQVVGVISDVAIDCEGGITRASTLANSDVLGWLRARLPDESFRVDSPTGSEGGAGGEGGASPAGESGAGPISGRAGEASSVGGSSEAHATSGEPSGCSCRLAHKRSNSGAFWMLAILTLSMCRRRSHGRSGRNSCARYPFGQASISPSG